jgi:hypothetical protein
MSILARALASYSNGSLRTPLTPGNRSAAVHRLELRVSIPRGTKRTDGVNSTDMDFVIAAPAWIFPRSIINGLSHLIPSKRRNTEKPASLWYRGASHSYYRPRSHVAEFCIFFGNKVAVSAFLATGEQKGFMKVLVGEDDDRIVGFTMIGSAAGEVVAVVQMAMLAGTPYGRLAEAVLAHPTMAEGLGMLFSNLPRRSLQHVTPERAA